MIKPESRKTRKKCFAGAAISCSITVHGVNKFSSVNIYNVSKLVLINSTDLLMTVGSVMQNKQVIEERRNAGYGNDQHYRELNEREMRPLTPNAFALYYYPASYKLATT